MKEVSGAIPRDLRSDADATTPKSAATFLREMERAATGSGRKMVCRHPDIDDKPIESGDRRCVIDYGRRADCDIASGDSVPRKQACPFWKPMLRKAPVGATPEQTLRLIAICRAAPALTDALRTIWAKDELAGGVKLPQTDPTGSADSQDTAPAGPTVGAKTPSPPLADGEPETP